MTQYSTGVHMIEPTSQPNWILHQQCFDVLSPVYIIFNTVFYWSCGLVGVPDAKERDLRDWGMSSTK